MLGSPRFRCVIMCQCSQYAQRVSHITRWIVLTLAFATLSQTHVIIGVELPRAASGYTDRPAALSAATVSPHRPAAYDARPRSARACVVSIIAPHEAEAFRAQMEQSGCSVEELHSARELIETLQP